MVMIVAVGATIAVIVAEMPGAAHPLLITRVVVAVIDVMMIVVIVAVAVMIGTASAHAVTAAAEMDTEAERIEVVVTTATAETIETVVEVVVTVVQTHTAETIETTGVRRSSVKRDSMTVAQMAVHGIFPRYRPNSRTRSQLSQPKRTCCHCKDWMIFSTASKMSASTTSPTGRTSWSSSLLTTRAGRA